MHVYEDVDKPGNCYTVIPVVLPKPQCLHPWKYGSKKDQDHFIFPKILKPVGMIKQHKPRSNCSRKEQSYQVLTVYHSISTF